MKNGFLVFLRSNWVFIALVAGLVWMACIRVYYWLKPWLPLALRLGMRRWVARRQRARHGGEWPLLESAGERPTWFLGWPEDRKFAFVLTHDVELSKGLDRVKKLAEVEMALGMRSSFNFIPEGTYQVPPELRAWLVEHDFEVGVHDHRHDGHLYKSRSHFVQSAGRINHFLKEWDACGFRSGFMLHNLEWIEDLNIKYDASTFDTDPFEPQPDGVKTIFPFWHSGRNSRGYMELPYTLVQDSTLFVLLGDKSNDVWKQKLRWIASRGGMALVNVHPDYLTFEGEDPQMGEFPIELYTEFLSWVKHHYSNQYWHALPRDIAEHCRTQIHDGKPDLAHVRTASGRSEICK